MSARGAEVAERGGEGAAMVEMSTVGVGRGAVGGGLSGRCRSASAVADRLACWSGTVELFVRDGFAGREVPEFAACIEESQKAPQGGRSSTITCGNLWSLLRNDVGLHIKEDGYQSSHKQQEQAQNLLSV